MLSWEYPPRLVGGISRHVQELSRALVAKGTPVTVFTAPHPGAPAEEDDQGVRVLRADVDLDTGDFIPWVRRLNEAIERRADELIAAGERPALLHAHDWLVDFAAKNLKLRHKLPLVATVHATEYGRNYGIHTELQSYISSVEWELAYEAWRVICCSYCMRDEVGHCLGTPQDKIDVIPNGIDASKFNHQFDRDAFRSAYATPDEKIVFFVGRMVREKGVSVLLDAFQRVLPQYNGVKLVIAGGGNRDHLVRQAQDLGIADRVYFTGYIDDETLIRLYLTADVAVFPSLYEPFGIVALEAMASHTPVVVSDAGGLREVVSHGVDGISTWAGNADSLAWGILEVLKNPEGARAMADNAYRKATTVFSWETIAAQTQDCYARVLGESRAGGWGAPEA